MTLHIQQEQWIKALEAPRLGKESFKAFDMANYSKSVFGVFTGEQTAVTLEAENSMVGVLIDRFGKDIPLLPRRRQSFPHNGQRQRQPTGHRLDRRHWERHSRRRP